MLKLYLFQNYIHLFRCSYKQSKKAHKRRAPEVHLCLVQGGNEGFCFWPLTSLRHCIWSTAADYWPQAGSHLQLQEKQKQIMCSFSLKPDFTIKSCCSTMSFPLQPPSSWNVVANYSREHLHIQLPWSPCYWPHHILWASSVYCPISQPCLEGEVNCLAQYNSFTSHWRPVVGWELNMTFMQLW